MPERKTIERAKRDKREGKSPSTQAGEFVRQEMRHIREGKHGAKNTKQAIAIGLSEARRAGVEIPRRGKSAAASSSKSSSRRRSRSRRWRASGAAECRPSGRAPASGRSSGSRARRPPVAR